MRLSSPAETDLHAAELRGLLASANAATIIPDDLDARHPLLAAVVPDAAQRVQPRQA